MRWLDPFIAAMLGTIAVAAVLPARGAGADVADLVATLAVALLFFLHGARMAPRTALAGARHWRLHAATMATTFVLFPLLGLLAVVLTPDLLSTDLYRGLLFLCAAPSTVQSSIAFTSIAHGNVPAAVFSASFSNLAGIVLTPLLAVALLGGSGHVVFDAGSVGVVVLQLLVPFAAGQLSRRWTAGWLDRHRRLTTLADRGSILLVVYAAFSAGVAAGIWHAISPPRLAVLLAVVVALLGVVLAATYGLGRLLRFPRADRVTLLFCGSKKSLATGLPMATVLFGTQGLGLLILPIMAFHQIQLIVCTAIARRWGAAAEPD